MCPFFFLDEKEAKNQGLCLVHGWKHDASHAQVLKAAWE
jgi:hypothetical protein